MAERSASSRQLSIEAFRAALPAGRARSAIADELCALSLHQHLAKGDALACDHRDDRLVFMASGAAKLVAYLPAPAPVPAPAGAPPASPAPLASAAIGAGSNGAMQVLAFHFAGDIISVLRQGTRATEGDFRLIALDDCELVVFSTDAFLDLAQSDPIVLRWVLAGSLQALHRSRTRMMQLGHKSARQRIADFLVSMAERLSDSTSGACRLILPMSRRDIGDSLGLTIETVSRQFTELRDAGLIETKGRSLVKLMDISALAQAAGYPQLQPALR